MGRLIFILLLVFSGCYKVWWVESEYVDAPNWASDNVVLFLYTVEKIKWVENRVTGGRWPDEVEGFTYLYEVDTLGSYRRVGKVFSEAKRFSYLSVGGEWVVISVDDGPIYAMRRDLSEIRKVGYGGQADLSPDGKKFVYVKPNKGLWIKNIDGTNDHQIVNDSNVTHPAWSSDGRRIAFYMNYKGLLIIDTLGNILDSLGFRHFPDWGPADSNAIVATLYSIDKGVIIHLNNHTEDTLNITAHEWPIKWSPSGNLFISYLTIYTRNGTKLFRIKP